MGGHGHQVHIHYNQHALKESDQEIVNKIQRIDLVKFNPMLFHLDAFNPINWYTISGGAPTLAFGTLGALFSYSYYAS